MGIPFSLGFSPDILTSRILHTAALWSLQGTHTTVSFTPGQILRDDTLDREGDISVGLTRVRQLYLI